MIDSQPIIPGLKPNGPIVVSSTPLTESLDNIRRMEDVRRGDGAHIAVRRAVGAGSRALDDDLSRGTSRSPSRLPTCRNSPTIA